MRLKTYAVIQKSKNLKKKTMSIKNSETCYDFFRKMLFLTTHNYLK